MKPNRPFFIERLSPLLRPGLSGLLLVVIVGGMVGWLSRAAQALVYAAEPATSDERARRYFTDDLVIDQHGQAHRFYSDLLAGHTVLIHAFYAHCREACPLQVERLRLVRERIGTAFGSTVRFLSLSVDVTRDRPEELKAFALRHGADEPGWYFLSGDPARFPQIVKRLGLWTDDPSDHHTLFIVGRAATKHWKKLPPDASPETVALVLKQLADE
ncbi:MAG: SCO family protein [Nitrospira sp.]|nr:SCO family protein [Nitrospira sp.]MCP9442064.1 SCO family protein [Nitrospira sp.]